MGRIGIGVLVFIDAWIALGGPPFLVIALAYVRLEGLGFGLAMLVLALCWVVVPWAGLVVAWRQSRGGAGRGRIAFILLVPIAVAMIGGAVLGSLPTRGV